MNRWTATFATAFAFGLRRNPLGLVAALAVRERSTPVHYPPNRPHIPLDVSWPGYWQALQECDACWKRSPARFSVFPPGHSWVGVIRKLRPSMSQDWSLFDAEHQKRLLGCAAKDDDDWALLGNMRGPAVKAVFGKSATRHRIERTVKGVIAAQDSVFSRPPPPLTRA